MQSAWKRLRLRRKKLSVLPRKGTGSMENKKQKGILYTLCFACIMLIDWSRGSLPWHYWAASLNITGVVMAMVMASHFTWKGQAVKKYMLWLTVWLAGSIAGYLWWRVHPGNVLLLQYVTAAVMIGCLGIVGLRIWQERRLLQQSSVGPTFLVSIWAILSVLMLFSRFGELWPIWFLVMFGMFYIIPYSKEERECLWDGLANGIIFGFFLIQIFAYGFRPYDEVRYKGAYSNCNVNALMYLVAYIMVLYRIHSMFWREKISQEMKASHLWHIARKGSKADGAARRMRRMEATEKKQRTRVLGKIFYLVLGAGLFCFILFTMTRTAILAAIGLTIAYGVLEVFFLRNRRVRQMLVDGVTFCICVLLLFPCVYMTIRYLPTILHHPIWWDGEYSEEKVHSFDPYDSDKYVSLEEVLGEVLGRFGVALSIEDESVEKDAVSDEIQGNAVEDAVSDEIQGNAAEDAVTNEMQDNAVADAVPETNAGLDMTTEQQNETLGLILLEEQQISQVQAAEQDGMAQNNGIAQDAAVQDDSTLQGTVTAQEEALLQDNTTASANITADAEKLLTEEEKQLLTGEAAQSSGRIRLEIYKRYLRHMNLTGHTLTEGYFPITEDYHAWHAQNIFLQVGFYHGIPAGICFVVLMLALGVYYWRLAIRGKRREDILPLLVWLLFVGFGMLECVWYLGQSILFLMYLVPKILVDNVRDNRN